jgi:4-carboxymuconolactone decarboxylase
MADETYERGMRVRREVLGDAHVDRSERNKDAFTNDFQRFITETAWGSVWARPGLDRKSRSLVTIGMLAALGRYDELRLHVRATQNTGVSREEVVEVLLHAAVYGGVPAANSAFQHAREVYAELDEESKP